jgi:hypothetical protein
MRSPLHRGLACFLLLPILASCESDTASTPTAPDARLARAADVSRLSVPDEHPNGPFYSMIGLSPISGVLRLPHTEEWGAVPLLREPSCIPPDFNLLLVFHPAALSCPSLLAGHLIGTGFGTPQMVLIQSQLHGAGDVPIVFASWDDLAAAVQDDVLTLSELLALPSAFVADASRYRETVVTGSQPPGGVAFRLTASGSTPGGDSFRLHYVDQGPESDVSAVAQIVFE